MYEERSILHSATVLVLACCIDTSVLHYISICTSLCFLNSLSVIDSTRISEGEAVRIRV